MSSIFIIAQHRTGSTLLKNIVGAHSSVEMAFDEMNIYEPLRSNTLDLFFKGGEKSSLDLIDALKEKRIYGTFWQEFEKSGITFEQLETSLNKYNSLSVKHVMSSVLNLLKMKKRVPVSGVKYPVHFSKTPLLESWFPESKIIFLFRNPKAMISSKLNDGATRERKSKSLLHKYLFHYFTLLYFCFEFRHSVKVYKQMKDKCFKITYEDLILNQKKIVDQICIYCDLEFQEGMLQVSGQESSYNKVDRKALSTESLEIYKKVLSGFDQALIGFLTNKSYRSIS